MRAAPVHMSNIAQIVGFASKLCTQARPQYTYMTQKTRLHGAANVDGRGLEDCWAMQPTQGKMSGRRIRRDGAYCEGSNSEARDT